MAVPPRLPNLDPRDMQWVRWATQELKNLSTGHEMLKTNVGAITNQNSTTQNAISTQHQKFVGSAQLETPTGPPQVPTTPILTTDHGTVTVRWDGNVFSRTPGSDAFSTPDVGFAHVSVQRGDAISGPWTEVGANVGRASSVVDSDVIVGHTYFYTLTTTDTLGRKSAPSTAASVLVKGVDLGTLDQDVHDALQAAQDAADAGLAAGQAGQQAAADAQAAANSVAAQAANALQIANDAQQTAQSAYAAAEEAAGGATSIVIQSSTPAGATAVLWIDTTGGANTPKRWDGSQWVAITDKAATDAAAAAVAAQNAANAAQTTANTAVTNAGNAQTTANSALTAANGKNKVIYSTSAASGTTGYISGDVWFQHDVSNVVIAQWQFSGTAWVSQSVSGAIVASGINAGNITAGSLSAARIAANTISASQMIAGTITAASGILADAVITTAKIADLAVSTAKIADLAVSSAKINDLDAAKIQAGTITAGKLSTNSVVTNNIVAGAIDTNRIAAGAITADKLSIGAVQQKGEPTNRVPALVTDSTYWGLVVSGVTPGFSYRQATASSAGLTLGAGGAGGTRQSITGQYIPVPQSRKLNISITAPNGTLYVREFNATNVLLRETIVPASYTYQFAADAISYEVFVANFSTTASTLISAATVFEVIGKGGSGQSAELTPDGLRLFDTNANLAVDLTTASSQFLNVYDNTQAEPISVASIDNVGNASFNEVSADFGLDISGVMLTDVSAPDSLFNAAPNGTSWQSDTPLLDRLSRGVIYDVTWDSLDNYTVAANRSSLRIAQDSFILEDGRQYMISVHNGGLQMDNSNTNNVYFELQLSTTPITDISTGVNVLRSVVYGNDQATWVAQAPIFSASAAVSTIASSATLNNRVLPAGVQIYWQLDVSQGGTVPNAWTLHEFGYARGLTIIDLGSNNLMRPNNGADNLSNVSNIVQIAASGTAPAGSGSTGQTATSKTVTFTAKASRTYNNSGSSVVSGSGQYTNGAAMYYGYGNSPMGSWFGTFQDGSGRSLNSVVGGKTVTAAVLTVKNTYVSYSSGATVQFGTGSINSAPGSLGTPSNNVWSTTFTNGSSKSITLNSSVRSGLSNGSVQSFQMGYSGSTTNYSYFHGATQSYPPTLKVTYH